MAESVHASFEIVQASVYCFCPTIVNHAQQGIEICFFHSFKILSSSVLRLYCLQAASPFGMNVVMNLFWRCILWLNPEGMSWGLSSFNLSTLEFSHFLLH